MSSTAHGGESGRFVVVPVPVVSVILPVYNGAATLRTALGSILGQSLSNLEVLVVDDGSADDSALIARELAESDGRIRVFAQPYNRGPAAARNLALNNARGRWIALVDADDEIPPYRLSRLSEAGDAAGADFIADGVEFAGRRQRGTPERLQACDAADGDTRTLSLEKLIRSDIPLNGLCSFGYLKPLMRREFVESRELRYDEELRFAEDFNLYVQALMHGARFVLHPEIMYIYNQTPVSASRDIRALPKIADHALVNNRRMRELTWQHGITGLDALLEEHEQRWSTVLWFNSLKLALRSGRVTDALNLARRCPSGASAVIRFVRDRARARATRGGEQVFDW